MFALAIHRVELPIEEATKIIAGALRLTLYEARQMAIVASPGPVVAATFLDERTARARADDLSRSGIPALVVGDDDFIGASKRFLVRRFELAQTELVVESRAGQTRTVAYAEIDLLLRGISVTSYPVSEVETSRKPSVGRAMLTGGLVLTKKVETVRKGTASKRSGFLYVHTPGAQPIELNENELQYDGLGAEMKPTGALNFAHLCRELEHRSGNAISDERLLKRVRQVQLLGPKLSPEDFLDVATTLLAMALRCGRDS